MSALRPRAIVAACLATVICAVGWPQPTMWALGIVAGSAALYVGVPQLVRELRARRPARDCPACDAGVEHTEHCPTPETHNWGCGCPTDQAHADATGEQA